MILKVKRLSFGERHFKANTDDIRETPAIDTAVELHKAGAKVRIHDPEAADHFESLMAKMGIPVDQFENKYDALNGPMVYWFLLSGSSTALLILKRLSLA